MTHKLDANRLLTLELAQQQRASHLSLLLDEIKQVKVIESGYSLRFEPVPASLLVISDWLMIETLCQPFLRMRLTIESNQGPIWLDLSGPAGTQSFLKSEYGLSRWL